eukprot:TRINITY_DN4267_c0_g1_i1.p1 TRINITY_DN4267_c0_g1~~TRINITY_DN4267_c0_g1_i1.p1  ORF type:complete len:581 (+),score=122.00 TRINITY_DN4267_c0_g1_i1:196-1938(+)
MEEVGTKKERLQKAFVDLDEHREALTKCTIQWRELEDHFNSLELDIKKKLEDLEGKERAFEAKTKEIQEVLDKREQSIASKEEASLARVQQQKDAAIALIAEERSKWKSEIAASEDKKVRAQDDPKKIKSNSTPNAKADDFPDEQSKNDAVRDELKTLCETMDPKGLLKFLVEHKKDAAALRSELPHALSSATDPTRLVLGCLEDFNSSEQPQSLDKKETGLTARRHACILVLESLLNVLTEPSMGGEYQVVPSSMKEKAKNIAVEWKSKINIDGDGSNGNTSEAWAFLQLLATFDIASDFDKDELCKIILSVARKNQTPELCRSLGLSSKMPELVETLVKSGKQVEAVNFAYAFGLTENFPPVPLLKEFLKDAKKACQASLKSGNNSTAAQNEANTKELSAIRAVIRCIEKHKLESQYSPEPLQKRVAQLEKAKADRKRSAGAVKSQPKRPRANANVYAPQFGAAERSPQLYASTNGAADRSFFRPMDRVQYPAATSGIASYNLKGQSAYDRTNQGIYGSAYVANRSPVSLSRSYIYPGENLSPSLLGSGSYNSTATYNNLHFSSGLAHPQSGYPSYIH